MILYGTPNECCLLSEPRAQTRVPSIWSCLLIALSLFVIAGGCATQEEWDRFWAGFQDKGEQPSANPPLASNSRAVQGTVGEYVTIDGLRMNHVRGFGLVVDLIDTGGVDGPERVKDYITKEVRRSQEIGAPGETVDEILKGRDSAMVNVTGQIPAGAKKGDRFDLVVEKMGSQTRSLVGGRLVLCELKLFADTPSGVIEGKPLALGSGPVFVSPFDRAGLATSKVDLKLGFVLGGGVVKEPRKIRLVLNDPRYSIAQQIVSRLNGRYAKADPIADAKGASTIELTIPPEFQDRKRVFLERVMHTTLNEHPATLERRAKELSDEIMIEGAEYESIGLAWEAIGKVALPIVREHYLSPKPEIAYFSGRTGLRLEDNNSVAVVGKCARDPNSAYRLQAIDELGYATVLHGAGEQLRKLLDDPDEDIRIRAYLALRRRPHPAIESKVMDRDNFVLDIVDSKGPFLIYVQRLVEPRIAMFGTQMKCHPPAVFPGERNDGRRLLTQISAMRDDDHLTVIYRNKRSGINSPRLEAPLLVRDLVKFLGDRFETDDNGRPTGLAVPYSEVIDIFYAFCKSETIPGQLVVEEATAREEGADSKEREESEY
jgi:flagellar P-ring protein FlgI